MYSIHYTLRQNTNVKRNFLQTNYTVQKCLFFLRAPTYHSFTFNLWFLCELKHKVCLSKSVCEIFYFQFRLIFMKVYFFIQQNVRILSLTSKLHNSFQKENNGKARHNFAPTTLIFKLQQEVLKFNGICVNWSSRKTDMVTNFLNFENRNFENASFSQ